MLHLVNAYNKYRVFFIIRVSKLFISILLFTKSSLCADSNSLLNCNNSSLEDMVLIPGGTFQMGGDAGLMNGNSQSHNTSYPIHKVKVDSFWMDQTEVTNAQYAAFVEATDYVTFAERPLPEAYLKNMLDLADVKIIELEKLVQKLNGREREAVINQIERIKTATNMGDFAGAIVFAPPQNKIYRKYDYTQWWRLSPGASWRKPDGLGSTWIGRENHPVVNVTYEDAAAYAKWSGKRLPTEAEWERAARGGLERKPFTWGDDLPSESGGAWLANIWQGVWPYENTAADGYVGTAPVKSFPANAYGLYDMSGNVWEIVADLYYENTYEMRSGKVTQNPQGPSQSFLMLSGQHYKSFVTRGGSFLCSDAWCRGYQPGSRQFMESDSPSNHTGFRCVRDMSP